MDDLVSDIAVKDADLLEEVSRVAFHSVFFGAHVALDDDLYCSVMFFLAVDKMESYLKRC